MNDVSVKHPEWLDIDVNGTISHGYDQEWFDDEWQRLSGCGPTSATQVLSYSEFRDGLLDVSTTANHTLSIRTYECRVELCKTKIWWWRL